MKSLVEYINERGAAPSLPIFKSESTNSIIKTNTILAYAINGESDIEKMFNALDKEQFGNDYVICIVTDVKNNEYIVDIENKYKFEQSDGWIIVNLDDDREIYNAKTISTAFIGLIIFDSKKIKNVK